MSDQEKPTDPLQFPTALILTGPKPPAGKNWCAVCCFLHQARVAQDEIEQEKCIQGYRLAQAQERQYFEYRIPNTSGYPMYEAVTIGPSPQFPNVILPVCWQHLLAYHPEGQATSIPSDSLPGSRLIQGKHYRQKGEKDDLRDDSPGSDGSNSHS